MDYNNDLQNIIERYLADKLSPDEKIEFEKRLNSDTALSKEVEFMRHITTAFDRNAERGAINELKNTDEKEIRNIIMAVEKGLSSKSKVKRLVTGICSVAAVVAAILIIIGLQPRYSTSNLYAEYYETPVYVQGLPSRGGNMITNEEQKELDNATEYYKKGDYINSLNILNKIAVNKNPEELPDNIAFYLAVCMIEINQTEKAKPLLKHVSELDYSEFQEDAEWLQALIYLKKGKRKEANTILSDIEDNRGFYSEKAKELLAKNKEKRWF